MKKKEVFISDEENQQNQKDLVLDLLLRVWVEFQRVERRTEQCEHNMKTGKKR